MKEKGCFLIADDVGLGKTKCARTVLFEMIRLSDNPIRAIYIASSEPLAKINLYDEFLGERRVKSCAEHYNGLAVFQKKHSEKALQMLWDKNYKYDPDDCTKPSPQKVLNELRSAGRLSMLRPEDLNGKGSCIMQLSPQTSFFDPRLEESITAVVRSINKELKNSQYIGSENERKQLADDFENAVGQGAKKTSLLSGEIIRAARFEYGNEEKALEQLKAICYKLQSKDSISRSDFLTARRIRANASAAFYKPDLIILDEFQRYRYIIDKVKNDGYTIPYMLEYLEWRKKEIDPSTFIPKILLLSATPYELNKNDFEINWSYSGNKDAYNAESKYDNRNKLFANMGELIASMEKLGAEVGSEQQNDYLVRTERNFKKPDIRFERDINASKEHQTKYLDPLVKYCIKDLKLNAETVNMVCEQAFENPEFWRFNAGYTKYCTLKQNDQRQKLLSECTDKDWVYDDLPMKLLNRHVFDEKTGTDLPILWVPPVSMGKPGSGKTLVFTAMAVSTRCVAYFCDRYSKSLLNAESFSDDPEDDVIDDLKKIVKDELKKIVKDELQEEKIGNLCKAIKKFFKRPFVRNVIAAHNVKRGWSCTSYSQAIRKYCDEYKFRDMIKEWIPIADRMKGAAGKDKTAADIIAEAFSYQPASIKERKLIEGKEKFVFTNTNYVEMFVCDDAKSGSPEKIDTDESDKHTIDDETEIVRHFNSPLYPMVLVARSSAQEGHNLQYYGDKIMHWQTACRTSAFLQREGRLDRPGSLTLRHRLWQQACSVRTPKDYNDAKIIFDEMNITDKNGLIPRWYIPDAKFCAAPAKITQILPVYEYNESLDKLAEQLTAAQTYSQPMNVKEEKKV